MDLGNVSNSKIYNNVVYGNNGFGVYIGPGSRGAAVINNIIASNLELALTNLGVDTRVAHDLVDRNPQFINVDAKDFRLQLSSSAIDVGMLLPEVATDFDGILRPQGAGYDIGAFEAQP